MQTVDERDFAAKAFVARGYDQCGEAYSASRGMAPPDWLTLLADRLKEGTSVLDTGCGSGIPITRALVPRFIVTGVDISAKQIERAGRAVPRAQFIHGDIMDQDFAPESFGGAVMIYTLFHLPRREQPDLLRRVRGWLRPGGFLLATLAHTSDPGYIEDDFFGVGMYWSHFNEEEYAPILEQAGFRILETSRIGHGYTTGDRDPEIHPHILAQRSE